MTTQEIIEAEQKEWSVDDSVSLYLIDRWGAGYFHVAEELAEDVFERKHVVGSRRVVES